MDLWVRSQDRERLSNCCDFRIYYDKNAKMWAIDSCDIVGYYISKERALEVLDEIQNAILGVIANEDVEKQRVKKYTGNALYSNNIIYEIPEE